MSRSYKKYPCVCQRKDRYYKRLANRVLRHVDPESIPCGKTNRASYQYVNKYDICDWSHRKSFNQWMVDRWRKYIEAVQYVEHDFQRWEYLPAGSTYYEDVVVKEYDWESGRLFEYKTHVTRTREKGVWRDSGRNNWRARWRKKDYDAGPPDVRKERIEWRKTYLRK